MEFQFYTASVNVQSDETEQILKLGKFHSYSACGRLFPFMKEIKFMLV